MAFCQLHNTYLSSCIRLLNLCWSPYVWWIISCFFQCCCNHLVMMNPAQLIVQSALFDCEVQIPLIMCLWIGVCVYVCVGGFMCSFILCYKVRYFYRGRTGRVGLSATAPFQVLYSLHASVLVRLSINPPDEMYCMLALLVQANTGMFKFYLYLLIFLLNLCGF